MKKINFVLFALGLSTLLYQSCNKAKDKPAGNNDHTYALVTRVEAGSVAARNNYFQMIDPFGGKTQYDNSNAVEVLASGAGGVFAFNGSLYMNSIMPTSVITRWVPNANNLFENKGSINVSELSMKGNLCFKDNNTAFVGGAGASKIFIFNPTTMQRTGAIDFTGKSRLGEVTNYPNTGDKINMQTVSEMIIRDHYLYVAVMLLNDFNTAKPATPNADMLVIDLNKVDPASTDNSAAVVKWISSDKGVSIGSWNTANGAKYMQQDENGDIYLLCHNVWSNSRVLTGKPACIIRIKKNETDFDPSYYFDLETPALGSKNTVNGFEYAGKGVFFATVNDLAAINPSDPFSYYTDPISKWFKFDLYNKTAQPVDNVYTKGVQTFISFFKDGKAYLPYETKTEKYIQEVDITSLQKKKLFTTNGSPTIFKVK